jgi:hypothetical protein
VKLLKYIELRSGYRDDGPAWIGYVTLSKTRRTVYFNDRALMKLKGQQRGESGGNHVDLETGESFWVSGVKKNGQDRHRAGSGMVLIEAAALHEYLNVIGTDRLNLARYAVTNSIRSTDVARISKRANEAARDSDQHEMSKHD